MLSVLSRYRISKVKTKSLCRWRVQRTIFILARYILYIFLLIHFTQATSIILAHFLHIALFSRTGFFFKKTPIRTEKKTSFSNWSPFAYSQSLCFVETHLHVTPCDQDLFNSLWLRIDNNLTYNQQPVSKYVQDHVTCRRVNHINLQRIGQIKLGDLINEPLRTDPLQPTLTTSRKNFLRNPIQQPLIHYINKRK